MRSVLLLVAVVLFAPGCATTSTTTSMQSNFVAPQATVRPDHYVENSMTKSSLLFPPTMTPQELDDLLRGALEKSPGSNVLLNCTAGSTLLGLPPIQPIYWRMHVFIRGTAAVVETTGYQYLTPFHSQAKQ